VPGLDPEFADRAADAARADDADLHAVLSRRGIDSRKQHAAGGSEDGASFPVHGSFLVDAL
jgi:hypothetical protein